MSSYFKNRITAASFYFNKILNDYPNTKYYNKVNIQMGLLDLKVGKINKFQDRLKDIILIDLNEEEKYEYFNVIAYFHDFYNETDNVKKSYSNSLKYANSKVKRIYTYNKLLEISKKQQDYVSCIKYIQGIQDNTDSPAVNKSSANFGN